jgi:hypothetical protein
MGSLAILSRCNSCSIVHLDFDTGIFIKRLLARVEYSSMSDSYFLIPSIAPTWWNQWSLVADNIPSFFEGSYRLGLTDFTDFILFV